MSTAERKTGRPAAFNPRDYAIEVEEPALPPDTATISDAPDDQAALPATIAQEPVGTGKRFSWGGLFLAAAGALVSLGAGLAATQFIEDLFARAPWLGWVASALAGLALLALVAIVLRELAGLIRLARISRLHEESGRAHRHRDEALARKVSSEIMRLYASRRDLKWGMDRVRTHHADIFDADDLLKHLERELMKPLDRQAALEVARAARRVSVVTAVSPNALIDMAFVLMSNMRMLRRLATLYGGRPGTLGLFRLTRMVIAHLTVTGGIALGDSVLQQFLGHGLASKLSARLGEGVINGLFTARIGLAAIEVVRPLPYLALQPTALKDVMGGLVTGNKDAAQ